MTIELPELPEYWTWGAPLGEPDVFTLYHSDGVKNRPTLTLVSTLKVYPDRKTDDRVFRVDEDDGSASWHSSLEEAALLSMMVSGRGGWL